MEKGSRRKEKGQMGNCLRKEQPSKQANAACQTQPSKQVNAASQTQSNQNNNLTRPNEQSTSADDAAGRLNAEVDVSDILENLTLSENHAELLPTEVTEKKDVIVSSKVQVLSKPKPSCSNVEQKLDTTDAPSNVDSVVQQQEPDLVDGIKGARYLDFTFLVDRKTISHIAKSKVMFIMRGLSGSGKSTIVAALKNVYKDVVVCSADDYFLRHGKYEFNPKGLTSAHENCQRNARQACEKGSNPVVIDNTNVQRWEMVKYFKMAAENGYTIILVVPQTPWKFDAKVLAVNNKHGVGVDVLSDKIKKFEQVTPIYWGWFVNLEGREQLYDMIQGYFTMCLKHFPDFETKLCHWLDLQKVPTNLQAVYNGRISPALHCTSFFAGMKDRSSETARSYANNPDVVAALYQIQDLEITGFNFTVGTAGAQVRLTPDQLPLWQNDDWKDTASLPVGSKAHITLGVTCDVQPVQTGADQIEILNLVHKSTKSSVVNTEDAKLLYFSDGSCHVELVKPFRISSMFSGIY